MSTYSSASKPAAIDIKSKRGLRSFYPTDKGSIQSYQLGHDGRIEFITAQVSTDHLYRGTWLLKFVSRYHATIVTKCLCSFRN